MKTTLKRSLRNKSSETTNKGLERAGEILDAAREVFASEGYDKLSMRGVAAKVGITLGTVQHYYATKEALFEAMLAHALEDMQAAADEMANEHGGSSPEEKFRAAMRYFIHELETPVTLGTFAGLKAVAIREPFAAEVMEKIFVRARKSVGRRIHELVPRIGEKELNVRSALIVAQLMGLTFYESGGLRKKRADQVEIERATLDLMLRIANPLSRMGEGEGK